MISSTPQKIGNLEIKNRFIRSATFESLASDGYVNDKLINFYKTLAEGGVGLIITGATAVNGNIRLALLRNEEELGWKIAMLPESRISVGTINEPAYNVPNAKEIKKVVDVPIIVVGGINSLELVEQILNEGSADFIALSRSLIREPHLPKRWLKGEGDYGVECIYCNGCKSGSRKGTHCVVLEKKERIARRKAK